MSSAKREIERQLNESSETPWLEATVAAIQSMRDSRFDSWGGYPAVVDGTTIPGYVLVADLDHDEAPTLDVCRTENAIQWFRDALAFLEHHPEFADDGTEWEEQNGASQGIAAAMHETEPQGIWL